MCLSLLLFNLTQAQIANHIVISEVYGGGGNSGALFQNDFVELYNPTSASVSLNGMTIQYASATGTSYSNKTKISGTIAAHGFFLIQEAAGTGTATALPTPDFIGIINMSGTNGKVALVADTASLTAADFTGANPTASRVIDYVGYGTANTYEGTGAAPALSNTTSGERKANASSTAASLASGGADVLEGNGWDSNVNSADFVSQTSINPQNSSSPAEPSLSPEANIITFTFAEQYAPAAVDYSDTTISITVVVGTSLTALIPTITVSPGATVNPTSGTPQDFTTPLVYTVTSSDGLSIKNWTVTVTVVPQVTIHDIQYTTATPADSPYKNEPVQTSGIVTASFAAGYFIQDGTTGWNGLYVYDNTHSPVKGDNITLTGKVSEYYNCTELSIITSYVVNSSGNTIPTPIALINSTAKDEQYEGMLLSISDGACIDTTAAGRWREVQGTETLVIGKLMYPYAKYVVIGTHYDVTGLLNYTLNQFTLEPRDAADVQIHVGIDELLAASANVSIYPNPTTDYLFVSNMYGATSVKISNLIGETIKEIAINGDAVKINVGNLTTGVYIITLQNKNKIIAAKKFSKE